MASDMSDNGDATTLAEQNATTRQEAVSPDSGRRRSAGHRISVLLRISFGILLLYILFRSIDLGEMGLVFGAISLVPTVWLCVVAIARRFIMAFKWNLLLRTRGIQIRFVDALRLYYVGYLVGTFTPGAIGADAYRVTALAGFRRHKVVAATILMERLIGLTVIVVFALGTLPFSARYLGVHSDAVALTIALTAVLVVCALAVSLHPGIVNAVARRIPFIRRLKVVRKVQEFYAVYAEYRFHRRKLTVFAFLTVVELVVLIGVSFFAARSLGIAVSFRFMLCVMPLVHILVRLPISVQGIGVQEGLFAYFLVAGGFTAAEGLSVSLVLRAVELLLGYLPAVVIIWLAPLQVAPTSAGQVTSSVTEGSRYP